MTAEGLATLTGLGGLVVLGAVAILLRWQEKRAARRATAAPALTAQDLVDYFMPPPAPEDEPSLWALGALSDARRAAAVPEVLAEPVIWRELEADWPRLRALLAPDADGQPTEADEILTAHLSGGGDGWAVAGHEHQADDALTFDGHYEAVPA